MMKFGRTMLTVMSLAVAAALSSSIPAQAQFLAVDCSGQNPFGFPSPFPSINSALFALQFSSPPSAGSGAFIGVESGPCNENVFISGALNLFLAAFGPVTL